MLSILDHKLKRQPSLRALYSILTRLGTGQIAVQLRYTGVELFRFCDFVKSGAHDQRRINRDDVKGRLLLLGKVPGGSFGKL